MKVFIAESSPGIYQRLVKLVSGIDDTEVIGENLASTETIKNILAFSPSALILDGDFDGGKGIEALKQLKKENPQIVVFVISDFPNPRYKKICFDAGADFFFDKSNEIEWMIETLKTLAHRAL
jgi:two-component system response regulator DevR